MLRHCWISVFVFTVVVVLMWLLKIWDWKVSVLKTWAWCFCCLSYELGNFAENSYIEQYFALTKSATRFCRLLNHCIIMVNVTLMFRFK